MVFFCDQGGVMERDQITYLPTKSLKPYKNNPRNNADAVDAVAASIKEYGFRSPIIITEDNTVINGHTRLKAAKKLGLSEVPCVRVTDLTEDQIKEYRLIDNKTSEYASWDKDLLAGELTGLDFGDLEFDFDFTGDLKKNKRWEESKKRCDLKDHIATHRANGTYYQALFKAGKEGRPLKELKVEANVWLFSQTALEYIRGSLGGNLCEGGWCILTTPRRRHGAGFHFATAVCEQIAMELRVPFYPDVVTCLNHDRLHPHFILESYPKERNVLLYDDILTTGCTLKATKDLLVEAGYTVSVLISIDNH